MTLVRSIVRSGSRALDAMAAHSLLAAEFRSYIRFRRSERKEPLLVYSVGKVGSSTLVVSLLANRTISERYSIYPLHRLTASGLQFVEQVSAEVRARLRGTSNPLRRFHPRHAWLGRWLRRRIVDRRCTRKWLVITLVREPISRNVSSFFQNLDEYRLSYDYRARLQSESHATVAADIGRLFDENYLKAEAMERIDANPLTWFDCELKAVFGVDVYASEFPVQKGYQIYESERAKVLMLRLEDLKRTHSSALKEFLGIDDFALVMANTGEAKAYSELYGSFLRNLTLPSEYIEELYGSRYARHFYTDDEIRAFRARWKTRGRSSGPQPSVSASRMG